MPRTRLLQFIEALRCEPVLRMLGAYAAALRHACDMGTVPPPALSMAPVVEKVHIRWLVFILNETCISAGFWPNDRTGQYRLPDNDDRDSGKSANQVQRLSLRTLMKCIPLQTGSALGGRLSLVGRQLYGEEKVCAGDGGVHTTCGATVKQSIRVRCDY